MGEVGTGEIMIDTDHTDQQLNTTVTTENQPETGSVVSAHIRQYEIAAAKAAEGEIDNARIEVYRVNKGLQTITPDDLKAIRGEAQKSNLAAAEQLRSLQALTPEKVMALHADEYSELLYKLTYLSDIEGFAEELVTPLMTAIIDRFEATPQQLAAEAFQDRTHYQGNLLQAHEVTERTRTLLWSLCGNDEFKIDPGQLDKLYGYLNSENALVRTQATEYIADLVRFDFRNQREGNGIGLVDRFKADIVNKLLSNKPEDDEMAYMMIEEVWAEWGSGTLPEIFKKAVMGVQDEAQAARVYRRFSDRLPEGEKSALKILFDEGNAPDFKGRAEYLLKTLHLLPDTGATATASELYERFDIGHWSPNEQLINFEGDLVANEFADSQKILDFGFGTGRHLRILKNKGFNMTGVDLVYRNVAQAKKEDPKSKVACASWFNVPFPDNSFDNAYCLGRSFPHNFTRVEMDKFLYEAHRVLKPDGSVIVDFPDTSKGFVSEQIQRFDKVADNLGIGFVEPGTHIGTPDKENYTLRFIPEDDQFVAISRLNGFKAEKIASKDYQDQKGAVNTNYYWKLTKTDDKLSGDEILELIARSHTATPPLYFSWMQF